MHMILGLTTWYQVTSDECHSWGKPIICQQLLIVPSLGVKTLDIPTFQVSISIIAVIVWVLFKQSHCWVSHPCHFQVTQAHSRLPDPLILAFFLLPIFLVTIEHQMVELCCGCICGDWAPHNQLFSVFWPFVVSCAVLTRYSHF